MCSTLRRADDPDNLVAAGQTHGQLPTELRKKEGREREELRTNRYSSFSVNVDDMYVGLIQT